MKTPVLLTPKQVAEILQVAEITLEVWRSKRIGPAWVKLGPGVRSPVRYDRAVINQYLKEQTR